MLLVLNTSSTSSIVCVRYAECLTFMKQYVLYSLIPGFKTISGHSSQSLERFSIDS